MSLQLITRGDDAGSSSSANRAIVECLERGILKNVSVMVPGPAFAEAASMLAGRSDVCLGLHVVLNAEWDAPKWGPVLPWTDVPSLVDEQGYFHPTPAVSRERGAVVEEMLAEIRAQLLQARDAGLRIEYVDEHMGVSWPWPDLREGIARLAREEGLVDAHGFRGLPPTDQAPEDPVDDLIARLAAAPSGTFVFVTHPTFDDVEIREYLHKGLEYGEVARARDADRRLLQDPRVKEACRARGVEIVRYTDANYA